MKTIKYIVIDSIKKDISEEVMEVEDGTNLYGIEKIFMNIFSCAWICYIANDLLNPINHYLITDLSNVSSLKNSFDLAHLGCNVNGKAIIIKADKFGQILSHQLKLPVLHKMITFK